MLRDGADDVDLWAMAAELERQFAGYKQRLAERGGDAPEVVGADADDGDGGRAEGAGDVRGRMYEVYTRRRDERLREGWRTRMARKEAEVKALWAQLERGGRASAPTADEGAEEEGEKILSSVDVLAPRSRVSGKKRHARTRSFTTPTVKLGNPDVGTRRALSQEPPTTSSHPPAARAGAGARRKSIHRARPVGVGTATPKRRALSGNRSSAREHGSPKPPRSMEDLKKAAPSSSRAPAHSCSSVQAADRDESQNSSSPMRPFLRSGNGVGTSRANARAASPDPDCGRVLDSVAAATGEAEVKNAAMETTVSPEKLGNGETASELETEPGYVYVRKKDAVDDTTRLSDRTLAGSDGTLHLDGSNGVANASEGANTAGEGATKNGEEAPATESSCESSFSRRSARAISAGPPSSSSSAQSIERLLEADVALLRKKREESAAQRTTHGLAARGSVGSRVSGTAARMLPREKPKGLKERLLNFGRKNKRRDATVIDCTSPSVPSLVDHGGSRGRCLSPDLKPRLASSDAAADDRDHRYAVSPQGLPTDNIELDFAASRSLQSLVAASPAKSELNEIVPQDKSPKARRALFSLKSLNCRKTWFEAMGI